MKNVPLVEKTWYCSVLTRFLAGDCVEVVGHPAAFARDIKTITSRLAAEGEAFLLKTLPALGRQIDAGLKEDGPLAITAFKKRRKSSAIPAFLQGLLCLVFNDDGKLKNAPSKPAIRLLRQVCYWFYKMERGYSEESLRKATSELIAIDAALPSSGDFTGRVDLVLAKALVTAVFNKFESARLKPKHGPGAVAEGGSVADKRELKHRFINLERCFRPYPYFYTMRDLAQNPQFLLGKIQCEYGLSRLEFVEKDSRGPRVISLEHSEYQWCQQALKRVMYDTIESHKLTKGHVNFTDQTVNRDLARLWRDFDTLDMSKASDRVSLAIVEFLFEKTRILRWLLAARSPGTVLPSGDILWFKKFAPMGSATCFPVQAIIFWALAVQALYSEGMPLWIALRSVYVYGDDLIVPHGHFAAINRLFESVALKFNADKCCFSGKFRESCGLDAYDGEIVTPLRLKTSELQGTLTDLTRLVKHANVLQEAGYWNAAGELRSWIRKFCPVTIPSSPHTLPILHFKQESDLNLLSRWRDSIRFVKGWVSKSITTPGKPAHARNYLLESLISEGPVGDMPPGESERCFARKYAQYHHNVWMVANAAAAETSLQLAISLCVAKQSPYPNHLLMKIRK